jgi:hypothetical protein
VPFLDTSRNVFTMPPSLNWGTTRIGSTPPNQTFPGFMNINRTQDFNISMTKVRATHTYKTGFYVNHSYKAQNFGAGGNGAPSFQGALSFAVDTNNPIESGFPFANAALGVYSSYGQQSAFIEGSFLYNNIEGFVQDNWKVNRKLTLDYGVRFVHQQPQYDQFDQVSTFRPETWNWRARRSAARLRRQHGDVSGANRVAMDPRTGAVLGPGSSMVGTSSSDRVTAPMG